MSVYFTKRKYENLTDGTEDFIKIVSEIFYTNKKEGYELMFEDIANIMFKSPYNIFDTKEECIEFVKIVCENC